MTFLSMTGCKRHAPCAAVVALLLLGMNGCASNVIGPDNNRAPEIRFYKHFQGSQDYPPRSAPAAITHDLEETLVKNGYYPVGDMEVYAANAAIPANSPVIRATTAWASPRATAPRNRSLEAIERAR